MALRTPSSAICKYPTYDKKMHSILSECQQWKHYIMGKETTIYTNHKALLKPKTYNILGVPTISEELIEELGLWDE